MPRVTVMTHNGAQRDHNEDAVAIGPLTICGLSQQDPATCEVPTPAIIAVADGMGGHAAGELASAHTVRTLATAPPTDIRDTLTRIDQELLAMSEKDPTITGLGTTVAGVVLTTTTATHFTAGDSRVYAEHGGYLAQLSTDDRGPTGGLTQCLGGRTDAAPLRVTVHPLPPADRLLLCTDGLSDLVPLETMEELLNRNEPPARITKSLWAAAMNAGGHDNITVALIDLH